MLIHEIYWVAGFLDGEGSFGWNASPTIQVLSTDKDLIEKCRRYMQVNVTIIEELPAQIHHKLRYKMYICGPKAIAWMMTLYPILCQRRKESIKAVIAKWKLASVDNKFKTHCPQGHLLSGTNLILEINGARRCRICKNHNQQKYRLVGQK